MPTLIKNVRNRNTVEFDAGSFDAWCVYLTRPGQVRYAPRDNEYFSKLKILGQLHGHKKIYDDFVKYYIPTTKNIDINVLTLITTITDGYSNDAEELDIWFTVIYAGMVAEENKSFAILKKRIKRLGMHQVLIEGLDANYAANFSKGKKWRELDGLMKQKGF
jgi:hypothetical protein